jgi:cobalt-precorrin-5B (C1)-methyltransferase
VKGALICLATGKAPEAVTVQLLIDKRLTIAIADCRKIGPDTARCTVIKDGGDDPDITHKAEIGAEVKIHRTDPSDTVQIRGGKGVGTVTKPGLETPPGQPAITSGPLKMIRMAVADVRKMHADTGAVDIEIFVPRGEVLARKTLNARLGILGGISILGTTGVVKPLSHAAYIATIDKSLSVGKAVGLDQAVFTTGRRSERFAQDKWPDLAPEAFIQIGDYFAKAMAMAAGYEFKRITIAIFFGKAVKMAQGIGHTHARSARLTLDQLARWAVEVTGSDRLAAQIRQANTARHVFDFIKDDYPALVSRVGHEIVGVARRFGDDRVDVRVTIFDFDGSLCFDSDEAEKGDEKK